MRWRFENVNDTFSIDVGTFLSNRSILIASVTGAIYMVKTLRTDTDANALVTLTIGSGITMVPAAGTDPDLAVIQFGASDFGVGALEITDATNLQYFTGFGIKIAGYTTFLEADLEDDRLIIVSDFIHD